MTNNDDVASNDIEDKEITIDHLKLALAGMKNNKTPGLDGLPREFYIKFFNIMSDDLCEVFNEITSNNQLPPSMCEAVTVLIPKKGDEQDPGNKRPISLLNVDYKIFAKIVSAELSAHLPTLISSVLTCSVPGRNITDNLIC